MVFSSIPSYLDPQNWNHQQLNHHQQANGSDNPQILPPLPPQVGGSTSTGGGMGSIRPGSMADRARLAKLPPPEPALKCPRCESTNTKFCYFNNYNLAQPRHFCKTCRRYWTKGGALRNVPVGGGCRRNNKKSKRNRSSKSPSNSTNSHEKQTCHQLPQQEITNLPLIASLQNHLSRYVVGNVDMVNHGVREIQDHHQQQTHNMGFQIGNNFVSVGVGGGAGGGVGVEPWRNLQQFPLFLNTFEGERNIEAQEASVFVGETASNSRVMDPQQPPVKMEENRSSLHNKNNQQYYSWNDISASSNSHLL